MKFNEKRFANHDAELRLNFEVRTVSARLMMSRVMWQVQRFLSTTKTVLYLPTLPSSYPYALSCASID